MNNLSSKYTCNICLKQVEKLSQDHIPPKCCGNYKKVKFRKVYFDENNKIKEFISQNGMKFQTICSSCNNELGSKYDKKIQEFMEYVISKISNGEWSFKYNCEDLKFLLKGIIGHIIATTSFEKSSNSLFDQALRNYYLYDEIPEKYELFLYIYPYQEIIFTAKNLYPIKIFNKKYAKDIPESMVTILYFFPFAFIFTEKGVLDGIKLFESLENNEITFGDNAMWFNKKINRILPHFWPLQIDSNIIDGIDALAGGIDSKNSIVAESE